MKTSESIAALAAALAKAQAAMTGARKDATNPHFKSSYATLASVLDAAREPLTSHGLAVAQGVSAANGAIVVTTRLMHASGEWIESELTVPVSKADAQGVGSAVSYGRRYSYAAMVGIAQVDDDANAATTAARATAQVAALSEAQAAALQGIRDAALDGMDAFKAAWRALPEDARDALRDQHFESLKRAAADADAPRRESMHA